MYLSSVMSFFCDPSIGNSRLLIPQQPLEFRNVIGSVFCLNTKRGNSGRVQDNCEKGIVFNVVKNVWFGMGI